jgi:hypothetical protein
VLAPRQLAEQKINVMVPHIVRSRILAVPQSNIAYFFEIEANHLPAG